jgi:uncharacterized peroxidase-related enzyme
MSRLLPVQPESATGDAKVILDRVQRAFGGIPNNLKTMATSPALLEGFFELYRALGKALPRQLQEQIAVAIADQNGCGYCLSAHSAVGGMVGLDNDELRRNQVGESSDPKTAAALRFARAVNGKRGDVSDEDVADFREAGYDDADLAAVIGHIALNVLTNYFNVVTRPELDFPEIELVRDGQS